MFGCRSSAVVAVRCSGGCWIRREFDWSLIRRVSQVCRVCDVIGRFMSAPGAGSGKLRLVEIRVVLLFPELITRNLTIGGVDLHLSKLESLFVTHYPWASRLNSLVGGLGSDQPKAP
jgi:hypothetical protein